MEQPYFIWDYDISEEEVREILRSHDEARKTWLIGRILQYARWDDIWKYLTLDVVQEYFDRVDWYLPDVKAMWAHALEVWSRDAGTRSLRESPGGYNYIPERQPQLVAGVLTPLQHAFLVQFFANPVGQWFWLTGGTALAAFYLGHRLSEDLDLFTVEPDALEHTRREIRGIAEALHGSLIGGISTPTYQQFFLTRPDAPPLKLDLVRDVGPQFGERRVVEGIIVDSLSNIAANKVTAILGRTEAKDFVDLYFLLHAGYELRTLISLARQKDPGLTEFYLGHTMRQVTRLKMLPRLVKPVTLEELQGFYLGLADNLLRMAGPPGQ